MRIGTKTVHVLASHPTPPSFDGGEDRNGRRNHDEIRFWADYVLPSKNLRVLDAGVWSPAPGEPGAELTGEYPFPTSDHRPVHIDIAIAGRR